MKRVHMLITERRETMNNKVFVLAPESVTIALFVPLN